METGITVSHLIVSDLIEGLGDRNCEFWRNFESGRWEMPLGGAVKRARKMTSPRRLAGGFFLLRVSADF